MEVTSGGSDSFLSDDEWDHPKKVEFKFIMTGKSRDGVLITHDNNFKVKYMTSM